MNVHERSAHEHTVKQNLRVMSLSMEEPRFVLFFCFLLFRASLLHTSPGSAAQRKAARGRGETLPYQHLMQGWLWQVQLRAVPRLRNQQRLGHGPLDCNREQAEPPVVPGEPG